MHMWHHVTNHLIISTDKDSNSENRIKLRVRDTEGPERDGKAGDGGVSHCTQGSAPTFHQNGAHAPLH
jgi:hypothetical protein